MAAGRCFTFNTFLTIVMLDCWTLSSGGLVGVPVIGKHASQSSMFSNYEASRAIDGNIGSWSETAVDDTHPWWRVDLGGRHCLGRITIYLTDLCCEWYFIGAVVRAGLSLDYTENQQCGSPATEEESKKGASVKFMCDLPVSARYVSVDVDPIRKPGAASLRVMLTELTVEELPSGECTSKNGVAIIGKLASQSSGTFSNYEASRAIDGNIDTWSETSGPHPWWRVDMADRHCLGKVTITLSDYCCEAYFIAAVVRAGLSQNYTENQQCGSPATAAQSQKGNSVAFLCDPPVLARYVSVDVDPARPGARSPPIVMIPELAVEDYASANCTSTSPGVTDAFLQTTISTPGDSTTIKDNYEQYPPMQACPKGVVTPAAGFKLLHGGRCISTTAGPLVTFSAGTVMGCTMRCKRSTLCTMFDYVTTSRRCRLYSQQVEEGTDQTVPEQGCLVYRNVVQAEARS